MAHFHNTECVFHMKFSCEKRTNFTERLKNFKNISIENTSLKTLFYCLKIGIKTIHHLCLKYSAKEVGFLDIYIQFYWLLKNSFQIRAKKL